MLRTMVFILSMYMIQTAVADTRTIQNTDIQATITVDDRWHKSLMEKAFYDTPFILSTHGFAERLLIQVVPSDVLFTTQEKSLDATELKQRLLHLNRLIGHDNFITQDSEISDSKRVSHSKFTAYVLQLEKPKQPQGVLLLINNAEGSFIFKYKGNAFDVDEMLAIASSYQQSEAKIDSKDVRFSYLNYQLHLPSGYSIKEVAQRDRDSYPPAPVEFEYGDNYFYVFSVCQMGTVPHNMMLDLAVDYYTKDEKDIISGLSAISAGKKLHYKSTIYGNDSGRYKAVAVSWDMPGNCQHSVVHLGLVNTDSILHLGRVVNGFTVDPSIQPEMSTLSELHQTMMADAMYEIGKAFYEVEAYEKSIAYFKQVLAIEPQKNAFVRLMRSYNFQGAYQQGADLLDTYSSYLSHEDTLAWRAWFYNKLKKYDQAITAYRELFEIKFYAEQDFFDFLDVLLQEKRYQTFESQVALHGKHVDAQNKLLFKQLKMLMEYQPEKAKRMIVKQLAQDNSHNDYLELLDMLGTLDAYQEVVDSLQKKLASGYDASGVYWNYLGDAQHQLGDTKNALASMKKAAQLSPASEKIQSYLSYLREVQGVADLTAIEQSIEAVGLPPQVQQKMQHIKPRYQDHSHEYLYSTTAIHFEPGQKRKISRYNKVHVHNQKGIEDNKTIRFKYSEEIDQVYINYFRVLDNAGTVIAELDRDSVYITSAKDDIGADEDKVLHIPVPSLSADVSIEWAITRETIDPVKQLSFRRILFASNYRKQYRAVYFTGDTEAISHQSDRLQAVEKLSEKELLWSVDELAYHKYTPYIPDLEDIYPWVALASKPSSWRAVGDAYLNDIEAKINTAFSLPAHLLQFSSADVVEKARHIAGLIQSNLSYQALEFGYRSMIPNTAEQTWYNKYGDCKDHAVLLYELLLSAGIEARLALVNTEEHVLEALPNTGQFNHMVVYLPEVNGGAFVDITNKDLFTDLLTPPRYIQGRKALVLEKDSSKLLGIPKLPAHLNTVQVERVIKREKQNLQTRERVQITGYTAGSIRAYLKKMQENEVQSKVYGWVTDHYPEAELSAFTHENLYDNSQPLVLEFIFNTELNQWNRQLPVFLERYMMKFDPAHDRALPFQYDHPFQLKAKTTIDQSGSKLRFKKRTEDISNDLMDWSLKATKYEMTFEAAIPHINQPAERYSDFIKGTTQSYKLMENSLDY